MLALVVVTMALGMGQKNHCVQDDWSGSTTRYTHMCYSDLPYLYVGRGFAELSWPYSDDEQVRSRYEVMEYPVGISMWAYATAYVTHWVAGSPDLGARASGDVAAMYADPQVTKETKLFVAVNAVGFAALALLAAWLLAGVHRDRPWDAAGFALSPALLLTGLINWDLLAVALVAGALWAWARERPVLTGVLIGLGAAAKLYPLFLLGGLAVICIRRRQWRELGLATLAAGLAWGLTNGPAYLTGASQWRHFWSFNSERSADLGSIWLVIDQATDKTISAATINDVSLLFFGLWCVGVAAIGLLAPTTPRLAQLGFLIVAGFLLINKVYSPQYVLWLLPLAALARPRWRDLAIWQATEVLYFASVWWYLGEFLAPGNGGDAGAYWVAIVLRIAGELWLVSVVARDIAKPAHDPVRQPTRHEAAPDPARGSRSLS